MFQHRRQKKLKVPTLWMSVTFRKLLLKNRPNDARARAFVGSRVWAHKWDRKHKMFYRRKRNSKNKFVEELLPIIWKFHKRFLPSVAQRTKAFGKTGGSSRTTAGGGVGHHIRVAINRCHTAPHEGPQIRTLPAGGVVERRPGTARIGERQGIYVGRVRQQVHRHFARV